MAFYLTIANRKGGVGKSTVAIMLAQAFSVWGGKRVLLVDLDSQCNASMILVGGEHWFRAKECGNTVADFMKSQSNGKQRSPADYLTEGAGDILDSSGQLPSLSLLAGSVALDEVEGELFFSEIDARSSSMMELSDSAQNGRGMVGDISTTVRNRMKEALQEFGGLFDIVVIDSAPGVSMSTIAALEIADKIIVPFRPDVVSQMAVDRVALLIERLGDLEGLNGLQFNDRRYVCLANFVRDRGHERLILEEIALLHPLMSANLPFRDELAGAFDWYEHRSTIEGKYGLAASDIQRVYDEVRRFVPD